MIKQAPSIKGMIAMVVFALSCFGILLFLWTSFGGPSPLKPQSYRLQAEFPESSLLVNEADVRISGLNVGKVKKKELNRAGGQIVTMDIDAKYAPIPSDAQAILRAKSLLGQIYIELTPGSESAPKLEDGGTLRSTQVQDTIFIDEILRTFDKPTRRRFQGWVRELAKAIDHDRGEDLNQGLGKLDRWVASGANLLEILHDQDPALRRLIRNGSIVLGAINERRGQFRELIGNANNTFGALASRNEALADTINVLPTFYDESRATLARLETFARNAQPVVRDLTPVAAKLRPTVEDLGALAPDLKQLFVKLDPLIDESGETLPEAAKFLRGVEPVLESLHVYLLQLNPVLSFFNYEQQQVADFIMNGAASLNAKFTGVSGEGPRHYLRQFSFINSRSQGIATARSDHDRGNSYPAPNYYKRKKAYGIGESWDCKGNVGGEQKDPKNNYPPCYIQPPQLYDGNYFPHVDEGQVRLKPPPKGTEGSDGNAQLREPKK
jgi:virulence factor Mce-like protein